MKKKWWIIFAIVILLIAITISYLIYSLPKQGNFSKTSLLRISIPLGGEYPASIKVSNDERTKQDFKVSFNNFDRLAKVEEGEFTLNPGEDKKINILFKDEKNVPGVYVGKLIISTSLKKEEIPVIFMLEDPNNAFAIILDSIPKYDSVYPGGKVGVEIKVYDLIGSTIPTVDAAYLIKNFEDDVIFTGEGNLIVGGGSKTELISIPLDWKKGDYIFMTSIDYKGTNSFGSYLFTISDKESTNLSGTFNIFIIIVIILVLLIFGTVFYFIKTRDDLFVQLKKQQYSELKRNIQFLNSSKKKIIKSEVHVEAKKKKVQEIEEIKKKVIDKLRKKQENQKEELKKLIKQSGKQKEGRNSIKKKVEGWKKQGYNMFETNQELQKTPHKGMKKELEQWKKKGYSVEFLTK